MFPVVNFNAELRMGFGCTARLPFSCWQEAQAGQRPLAGGNRCGHCLRAHLSSLASTSVENYRSLPRQLFDSTTAWPNQEKHHRFFFLKALANPNQLDKQSRHLLLNYRHNLPDVARHTPSFVLHRRAPPCTPCTPFTCWVRPAVPKIESCLVPESNRHPDSCLLACLRPALFRGSLPT